MNKQIVKDKYELHQEEMKDGQNIQYNEEEDLTRLMNRYREETDSLRLSEEWKEQRKAELLETSHKFRLQYKPIQRFALICSIALLLLVGSTTAYAAISGEGWNYFIRISNFGNAEKVNNVGVTDKVLLQDNDFRITLERGVTDGQIILLVCHVEALSEAAQSKIHEERYSAGIDPWNEYSGETIYDEDGKGFRMNGRMSYTDASRYWYENYYSNTEYSIVELDEKVSQPESIFIFAQGIEQEYLIQLRLSELGEAAPVKYAEVNESIDEKEFAIERVEVSSIGISLLGSVKKTVNVEALEELNVSVMLNNGSERKVMTCVPISTERFHKNDYEIAVLYSVSADGQNYWYCSSNIKYWKPEYGKPGARPSSICAMAQMEYELDDITAVRINDEVYELH